LRCNPPNKITLLRNVSLRVAIAVAKEAIADNKAGFTDFTDLETHIRERMWVPVYLPYKKY
jgi:malic enzyme